MNDRNGAMREGRDLPCIFSSKKLHPENNSVEHQSFKSNCRSNLLGILGTKRGHSCVIKRIFLTPASHQDDGSMHKANSLKLLYYYIIILLYYYIIRLLYYYIIILFYYFIIILLDDYIITFLYYYIIILLDY